MPTAPAIRQFAGDIRFWERDANGDLTPVIPDATDPSGNQPIETNALSFAYEPGDEQKIVSKRRDSRYNQPIHSETLPGTTSVNVTLLELPPLIMASILFGEGSGASVSAGSVTDAPLAITRKDAPLQLPHRLLLASPTPIVENGGVALVAGTDYEIDLRRGQVLILAAGVTVGDADVTISYSYAAHVATHIIGGATPTRKFFITGDMEDRINGENGELRIPQVSLSVTSDVDWLSAEPIQAEMSGDAIIAAGETAPYTFTLYRAQA